MGQAIYRQPLTEYVASDILLARYIYGITREGMGGRQGHVSPTPETFRGPTARLGPPHQGTGPVATRACSGAGPTRRSQPLVRTRGPRTHRGVLRDRTQLAVPRDRHPGSHPRDP